MIGSRNSNVNSGLEVGLWLISTFISTVSTMLLICILSVPIAWLTVLLNLSTTTFLVLSAIPTAISILIIQRHRFGERAVNTFVGLTLEQTVDLGGTHAVREVQRNWNEIQRFKKDLMAKWSELHKMVQRITGEVPELNRAIDEHERVVLELQGWANFPGVVPSSMYEVNQVVQRQRELAAKINDLIRRILDYDHQIRTAAVRLLLDSVANEEAREREWSRLKLQLESAEGLVPPTFWARIESMWRHQKLADYDRTYQQRIEEITEWLRRRFDPSPQVRRQNDILQPLAGRTIECQDGRVDLSILRLG